MHILFFEDSHHRNSYKEGYNAPSVSIYIDNEKSPSELQEEFNRFIKTISNIDSRETAFFNPHILSVNYIAWRGEFGSTDTQILIPAKNHICSDCIEVVCDNKIRPKIYVYDNYELISPKKSSVACFKYPESGSGKLKLRFVTVTNRNENYLEGYEDDKFKKFLISKIVPVEVEEFN